MKKTINIPHISNYVGEVKDGKRHGQGTLTYPDGINYVGQFKDDEFDSISMWHVLEHVPSLIETITEFTRILKKKWESNYCSSKS